MSSAGAKGIEGPAGPLVNEHFVTLAKDDFDGYLAEIQELHLQINYLLEVLHTISKWQPSSVTQPRQKIIDNMKFYAHVAISKATGGE